MNILGINSGRAAPVRVDPENNRPLSDGGAALIQGNKIACATIEERHTRIRYSSGFKLSSLACLREAGVSIEQIDTIGHSTCCDIPWSNEQDIIDSLVEAWRDDFSPDRISSHFQGKVFTIDHHESHAMLAFIGSGFYRSLVSVMDGIGNRYGEENKFNPEPDWWKGAFQRQTYYLCEWVNNRVQIRKVYEEACELGEIGLGELYRSVTHYLGWDSYQYSGKTMALASFGNANNLANAELIQFESPHHMRINVPDLHPDPFTQITTALTAAGCTVPEELHRPADPEQHFLCDVAALLQNQLESAMVKSVSSLADEYKTENIAFGGGVAMNCVALGKLSSERPDLNLYVPPAPADTGQALGNALWLAYAYANSSTLNGAGGIKRITSAALGPEYSNTEINKEIELFLVNNPEHKATQFLDEGDLCTEIVKRLLSGDVIALRIGRAEYGPRALGQSSIIADPRNKKMHDKVNNFKQREPFRPYAPSILLEYVSEYFEIDTGSPFMSFAGKVKEDKRSMIPAVVHVDGTARYQTVTSENGLYRTILEKFNEQSGVPVLLNTSFNIAGEPIVETPNDALDAYQRCGLDVLILGSWLIERIDQ